MGSLSKKPAMLSENAVASYPCPEILLLGLYLSDKLSHVSFRQQDVTVQG